MTYDFAHGSGTLNDPYQIWNQADLEGIGQDNSEGQPNYFENHFIQMADLALVNYDCNSLIMMSCTYDGDNHKVIGLEDFLFYQFLGEGIFKNLIFISPTIVKSGMDSNGTGIISYVGNYSGTAEINNVIVLGAVISGELSVGGFIGQADEASFSDCYVIGVKVSGEQYVGGFVGSANDCYFQRCITHGEVKATDEWSYAGGFAGYLRKNVLYCGADVDVIGEKCVGGFAGEGDCNIENCYALGNVTGYDYVGGFGGML